MDILNKSLLEIRDAIRKREVKAQDVVAATLEKIKKLDGKINSFITIDPSALERAEQIDRDIASGKTWGPLAGVPIAIKDNYCTKGLRTTAASKILGEFVPPYSATVVMNLENAGAICIGKTNLDEFAMGSTNENSAFGYVRNPWNPDYVPGGSSGGSAAAVAARMVTGATGSDTGGSIRLPSSYCGIAGIKPTYGRVSRYGIVAFASSLDQAGPMATNTRDCAALLEVMSGYDPKDSTSANKPVPHWLSSISTNLKGLKIGLPKEYFTENGVAPDVQKVLSTTIEKLKSVGAEFVSVDLPLTQYGVATYYIIAASEASSNLSRYDGVRYGLRIKSQDLNEMYMRSRGEGFGQEVKKRIMVGTYALSSGYYEAYYLKACKMRRLIQTDFTQAFKKCDIILGPVSTRTAFKLGEKNSNPLKTYLNDIYTTSANLAGLPGMSIPAGFGSKGLPVGVQIMAPYFEEQKIFNVAQAIEDLVKIDTRAPHVLR